MWQVKNQRDAYRARAKAYRAKSNPSPARVGKGILKDGVRRPGNVLQRMWKKLNGF